MTYSYKSTDKLEVGDYIYTPDFLVSWGGRLSVPTSSGFSPFAVWKVNHVTRKKVSLILLGSKDWIDVSALGPTGHYSITIKPEGPEKHGDGKFVRYIGKRPPWSLESA